MKNEREARGSLEMMYQLCFWLLSMASLFSISCSIGWTERPATLGEAFYLLCTFDPFIARYLLLGFVTHGQIAKQSSSYPLLCLRVLLALHCVYMCYPRVIQSQQDLIELLFIQGMLFSWITKENDLENKKSSLYLDLLL